MPSTFVFSCLYLTYTFFSVTMSNEEEKEEEDVAADAGLSEQGVPWPPQILAHQLTLSQLEGSNYAHHITIGPPEFSDFPTALADGHHSLGDSLGEAGNLVSQDRQQQHHHSYVGVLQRPRERFQSSVHGGQNLGITKSLEAAAAEHEVFVTLMRADHQGLF